MTLDASLIPWWGWLGIFALTAIFGWAGYSHSKKRGFYAGIVTFTLVTLGSANVVHAVTLNAPPPQSEAVVQEWVNDSHRAAEQREAEADHFTQTIHEYATLLDAEVLNTYPGKREADLHFKDDDSTIAVRLDDGHITILTGPWTNYVYHLDALQREARVDSYSEEG